MKYMVIEIQMFENGNVSSPTYSYDNRLSAEAKYHSILASAAVSKLPTHTCILTTSEGRMLMSQCYKHETEVD